MTYMTEKQAKKSMIEIGQRMYVRGFVAANDGNISVKTGDNEVWATPTGVSKGFMKKKMLVKVDLDGNVLEGTNRPSSELKMHLRAYRENPDILSVCHAHPPICTCFAIAGVPLDAPVLAEAIITLGDDSPLCRTWHQRGAGGDSSLLSHTQRSTSGESWSRNVGGRRVFRILSFGVHGILCKSTFDYRQDSGETK